MVAAHLQGIDRISAKELGKLWMVVSSAEEVKLRFRVIPPAREKVGAGGVVGLRGVVGEPVVGLGAASGVEDERVAVGVVVVGLHDVAA